MLEQQDLPHKQTAIYQLHSILLPLDSANPRDNSTGFTVQWGELGYPNNKSTDVYFPRSFSSTTYQVDLSFRKGSYANNSGCLLTWERVANNIVRISGGQQSSFTGCSWIAVGFS
ncbi:gp53-like domain-containing protein [Turicimonas sp. TL08]